MIIGILTDREDEFAQIVLNIRKKYSQGKFNNNEELTIVAIKETVVSNGMCVIVVDIKYLEKNNEKDMKDFFRQCRVLGIETVVGTPEYDSRLIPEVLGAIETYESNQVKGHSQLRTFDRIIETIPDYDNDANREKSGDEAIRIGVLGIGRSAGASFVALSLAKELSISKKNSDALVTLVSVGDTDVFEILGMEKRFAGRIFFRFFDAIKDKQSIRGRENVDERINWVVKTPNDSVSALSDEEKARLLYRIRGDIVLWDFSCNESDEEIKKNISECDFLICVIDPLPSKLLTAFSRLQIIRESGVSVYYVINKYNKGVNKKQLLDFLKVKNTIYIPLINQEFFYTAEYGCKLPYNMRDINSIASGPIRKLAALIGTV